MTVLFSKPQACRYGWRVTAMANKKPEDDPNNAMDSAVFVGWSTVSAKDALADADRQVDTYLGLRNPE